MKKIMFILAFTSMGIFASASNGKVKLPVKTVKIILDKSLKPELTQYSYIVTCPSGDVFTGCCYNSQSSAYLHGVAAAAQCYL